MIVEIVSGCIESAYVNGWMDRDKKINIPSLFYCLLHFTCGWWIACNKAAHVVSSIVLGAYLADVKNPVGVGVVYFPGM